MAWNSNTTYNHWNGSYFQGSVGIKYGDLSLYNGNIMCNELTETINNVTTTTGGTITSKNIIASNKLTIGSTNLDTTKLNVQYGNFTASDALNSLDTGNLISSQKGLFLMWNKASGQACSYFINHSGANPTAIFKFQNYKNQVLNGTCLTINLDGSLTFKDGTNISNATFSYLDATSSVQTQLNTKIGLSNNNVYTGTNTYNTSLPTSTLTPTLSSHLINKNYGDSTYLSSANLSTINNKLTDISYGSSLTTIANNLNVNGLINCIGQFNCISGISSLNSIQINSTNNISYLDFTTTSSGRDYDVRLAVTAGSDTVSGQGQLNIYAMSGIFIDGSLTTNNININGNILTNSKIITPLIFSYLSNVSSDLQTQLSSINTKITDISYGSNLTTIANNLNVNGLINCIGGISSRDIISLNSIQINSTNNLSYLDFTTTTTGRDYDVRLLTSGGSDTVSGQGQLNIYAMSGIIIDGTLTTNNININGNILTNSKIITPLIFSYLSNVSSDLQTQINNVVSNNTFSTLNLNGNLITNSTTITPSNLSCLSGSYLNINDTFTGFFNNINSLQNSNTVNTNNISTLQSNNTTNTNNISTLQSSNTTNTNNISTIQGQITTINSNINKSACCSIYYDGSNFAFRSTNGLGSNFSYSSSTGLFIYFNGATKPSNSYFTVNTNGNYTGNNVSLGNNLNILVHTKALQTISTTIYNGFYILWSKANLVTTNVTNLSTNNGFIDINCSW